MSKQIENPVELWNEYQEWLKSNKSHFEDNKESFRTFYSAKKNYIFLKVSTNPIYRKIKDGGLMNIQEEIKEIREGFKRLDVLQGEISDKIDKLEQEVTSQNNDYELYLEIDCDNSLKIVCLENDRTIHLGFIRENGECHILSEDNHKFNYNLWVSAGQKIRENNEVEWRGKKYWLTPKGFLINKTTCSDHIFNFETARVAINCEDDNILRYSHNNTPILF